MAELIYQFIEKNPGCTAYRLAKALGCSRTKVEDEMAWMNNLCEDDNGHLYTMTAAWILF